MQALTIIGPVQPDAQTDMLLAMTMMKKTSFSKLSMKKREMKSMVQKTKVRES